MEISTSIKNWQIDKFPDILKNIHQKDVNIAIYERDTNLLKKEIENLLEQDIKFSTNGDIKTIVDSIKNTFCSNKLDLIKNDIINLLQLFNKISKAESYRLLLATINTNMCRKFHADVNDLRMLCTYSGEGTLWLTEDNINRKALSAHSDNKSIVIDNKKIKQVKTGAVVILKGAIYPQTGTKAIIHRSPTIEETGIKRLLLRIDTNQFLNLQ